MQESWSDLAQNIWTSLGHERVPFGCEFEITHRCPFRCEHCWLGCLRDDSCEELTTCEIEDLLRQMAAQGTFWVTFTGGEPLLRPDAIPLMGLARQLGMIPKLFTNAFLIDSAMAQDLASVHPQVVEVTLYGTSNETYTQFTDCKGAFDRVVEGINALVRTGLNVALKAAITKSNAYQLGSMNEIASSMNLPFRFDAEMTPAIDGITSMSQVRLSPEEIAELETPYRRDPYSRKASALAGRRPVASQLCAAGHTVYHLDPKGYLSPCGLLRNIKVRALPSFREAWVELGRQLAGRCFVPETCRKCEYVAVCGVCPGWAFFEYGSETAKNLYKCQLTQRRVTRWIG